MIGAKCWLSVGIAAGLGHVPCKRHQGSKIRIFLGGPATDDSELGDVEVIASAASEPVIGASSKTD